MLKEKTPSWRLVVSREKGVALRLPPRDATGRREWALSEKNARNITHPAQKSVELGCVPAREKKERGKAIRRIFHQPIPGGGVKRKKRVQT